MWFQVILILAMATIAIYLVRSTPSDRHLAIRRITLFVALAAAVTVIMVPSWLTVVAHFFGIGRGTDLLLYASIVGFLLYVVTDYKKTVQQERATTALARELALTEARLEDALARERGDSVA